MTESEPLVDYIVRNRGTFTREAINAQLLGAGHPQSSIDAAWAELEATPERAIKRGTKPGPGTIFLALIVLAAYVLTAWLAFAVAGPNASLGITSGASTILLVYAIAMLIACAYSIRGLLRAPSTGGGARAIGIAFGISIAIFAGLSGLCLAGLSASG
jgi:hypothetical protein